MKNIVLCSDGTGNTAGKDRGTNVWKVYEAADTNGHRRDPELVRQVAFYDDGVGTEQVKLLKALGGAFGYGLKRNVLDLYQSLCRCYQPGDRIFLFGFSRGAYTVRALAGLIARCGIVATNGRSDRELERLSKRAYACFRKHFRTWQGAKLQQLRGVDAAEEATEAFRRDFAVQHPEHAPEGRAPIRFIGVWDTVDAVGLPLDHLADFLNNVVYAFRFSDYKLSPLVEMGCHALAIDDERHTFHPVLWDESEEEDGSGRIEQVWFAGAHSNVGGGYPKQGMSLVSLDWMMAKAEGQGLRFLAQRRNELGLAQNVHDKLYNSRAGLAVYYRYKVRDIERICRDHGVLPKIHESVLERISLATESYAPGNLPGEADLIATDTGGQSEPEARRPSNGRRLLDQVKGWVWCRRLAHYGFLALTLAIFLVAVLLGPADGASTLPSWLATGTAKMASLLPFGDWIHDEILMPLLSHPGYAIAFAGLLLAAYFLGLVARRRCRSVFSGFWRRVFAQPS